MPWFVLYTKSRYEKKVAESLRRKGVEVYCPLRKIERQWSDRKKIVETPLFKSYCFVNIEEKEREIVFSVEGVVRYLFWLNKPAVVRNEEIDAIKNLLNDFDHNLLEIVTMNVNDKVLIESGVFTDTEATVIATQGKKILVRIESLKLCILVDTSKNKVVKIQRRAKDL